MGLLLTDLRADFAVTRLAVLAPAALPGVRDAFRDLDAMAAEWFEAESISSPNRRTARTVDMRYAGQNYELPIRQPDGEIGPATLVALAERFAEAHRRMYGFIAEEDPVQLVTFRVEASGVVPKATFAAQADAGPDASGAIVGSREVWLPEAGGFTPCPVYDRDRLQAGNRFSGPAIIEQMDATTVVPPDWVARVESFLNVILEAA